MGLTVQLPLVFWDKMGDISILVKGYIYLSIYLDIHFHVIRSTISLGSNFCCFIERLQYISYTQKDDTKFKSCC